MREEKIVTFATHDTVNVIKNVMLYSLQTLITILFRLLFANSLIANIFNDDYNSKKPLINIMG